MSLLRRLLGFERGPVVETERLEARTPPQPLMLRRQVVDTSQLRIGMYVAELDRPWAETSFLFQGFTIESQRDLDELRASCKFVYVEALEEEDPAALEWASAAMLGGAAGMEEVANLRDRLAEVSAIQDEATSLLSSIFNDLRIGGELDGARVQRVIHSCIEQVLDNQNASLWLTQMRDQDVDGARHAMNVAVLSIALGRVSGLSREQLEVLGTCGLLHDVGKIRVPSEVLAQTEALSSTERDAVRLHTEHGRDLLLAKNYHLDTAAEVAYCHHERIDGRGYPRGLAGSAIPLYARMVSVTEAYDAITTKTHYRAGRSAHEALRILYKHRGTQFDEELVHAFITCIGIFPPGSLVEMWGGEVGIILSNCSIDKLKPRVLMLLGRQKEPIDQHVIDMIGNPMDGDGQPYRIRTTLRNGSYQIWIEEFVRAGLNIRAA